MNRAVKLTYCDSQYSATYHLLLTCITHVIKGTYARPRVWIPVKALSNTVHLKHASGVDSCIYTEIENVLIFRTTTVCHRNMRQMHIVWMTLRTIHICELKVFKNCLTKVLLPISLINYMTYITIYNVTYITYITKPISPISLKPISLTNYITYITISHVTYITYITYWLYYLHHYITCYLYHLYHYTYITCISLYLYVGALNE